jgi:hypothetical protein
MRTPPPLSLEIGADPAWAAVQGSLLTLGAGALVFWSALQRDAAPSWHWVAVLVLLVATAVPSALALHTRRAARPLRLTFDGVSWSCAQHHDGYMRRACMPALAIDLGNWMLLRIDEEQTARKIRRPFALRPGARRHWLAVSSVHAASQWHALRVALYSSDQVRTERRALDWPEG